ncbi:hypothetical protein ACIF85_23785 [Streptomyces sp. NPDC086033]|uniref:hypothetical protein n=1 Tax=Streptomyces sp. NPDC086033 TaxID=3365747 RepID=UPI0037D41C7D
MTAAPETGLTEREIIERAVALRRALLARQAETPSSMYEPLLRRVGCDTLGLPSEHIALIP